MGVHEDKMQRMNDDRKIYEASRDQLRNNIREFEMFCQDVTVANRRDQMTMKNHIMDDITK